MRKFLFLVVILVFVFPLQAQIPFNWSAVNWSMLNGLMQQMNKAQLRLSEAVGDIPPVERKALIALYDSTNGNKWIKNDNWLDEEVPVSKWHGVKLDPDEKNVVRLELDVNNLVGQIPSKIGDLTKLDVLDLRANQLSGSIPTELGNLIELTFLDLRANQLSGYIPSELGKLTKLKVLRLGENQLSGSIPPELGNLKYLVKFDLRADQNPCFFYIGAIKSIAGIKPSTELFDIFIKFNYWKGLFSFASIDFAFTEETDDEETDDEAKVTISNLTELSFSLNYDLNKLLKLQDRHIFLGFNIKVFDNDPYLGVHFGSLETNKALFSSYIMIGYLRRGYSINQEENAILDKKEFKHNLFIEFALHSPKLPFIQNIRLKGGILLPFRDKNGSPDENDIKFRITIEIPLGRVIRF